MTREEYDKKLKAFKATCQNKLTKLDDLSLIEQIFLLESKYKSVRDIPDHVMMVRSEMLDNFESRFGEQALDMLFDMLQPFTDKVALERMVRSIVATIEKMKEEELQEVPA